ncbi:TPR-like protein [Suillus weaverae]|nr:TPR-like protein [Suillus weaverae]
MQILTINTTARDACITGDLATADRLLTQEIDADSNDYNSYANRSFVMARTADWDRALDDAIKSINIEPSLMGCISKGIALCGKRQFQDAMKAFDLAFMFVDEDLNKTRLLLLIKAIALFNANQHEEAILRVQQLATTRPSANTLACGIVEAYLHVQVGINALDDARHNEAADHFTAAVGTINFSSTSAIHSEYDIFVVLFGWDLKSLWLTAHQHWCRSLLLAGRLTEAVRSYRHMMDESDEATKASCLDWSTEFKQDYSVLHAAKGDDALAAGNYDRAIELYSAAIDLDLATDAVFANRSKARSAKMLWDDALLDAQMVIKLTPSSHIGYQLQHAALHGAQRYDEAIDAFQTMSSKFENAPDTQTRMLRQQYVDAERAIQETIKAQLNDAPHRLLNTFTGRLCDREVQIDAFKTSTEYKELFSSTLVHVDLRMECIKDVVGTYFRYVMLSHRWEGKEPLLHDIQGKVAYDLDPVGGIAKLQSFCATARDKGYRWAWIDTCCIDQTNNVEVQQSVNSMFIWYHHSALTIIYLSDVPPSSQAGALASSVWNTRGWTVQEFLAPKFVLFYQKDWSLYLDDRSPNHKNSLAIMQEMGDATGIDSQALVAFRPGMRHAREKLQWVSARVTTWQEDIAYSLFGIFGVNLPVIYGEKKQKALGRLLEKVVAQSGDISALDWVGQSSEFNSCLPADITSYKALPYTPPSLSEGDIQTSISLLRQTVAVDLALKLYALLDDLKAARFADCRLHLPCIAFRVTAVKRSHAQDQEIYEVKADGLHDLPITTKDKLIQFSSPRPTMQAFLLEDIAYSLFGIFGVNLPVIYGEKKQKALGRLLEKVVAQSGDISALDWVGQSSEFNSCLPADITSYKALPYTPPSLSEGDIQTSISLLRQTVAVDLALKLYALLDDLKAARFADCRLHLPCIAFRVTAVKRSHAQDQEIYEVKADGLHDLPITTKDKLIQFSSPRPTMQAFLLVRPWNRYLLDLPDFAEPYDLAELPDVADNTQSKEGSWSAPGSPLQDSPGGFPQTQETVDSELSDRALRLTARLAQPFGAFLLAHQRSGEYKRIAPDHDIIAQVKDLSSIPDMVKTLEIL